MKNQLPDVAIANLFKNVLVLTDECLPEKKEAVSYEDKKNNDSDNKEKIWWLGSNKKNVTIVLADKEAKFLDDAELNFLLTILKACHLAADDISIVNIAQTPHSFSEIQKALNAQALILFGVAPLQISIPVKFSIYTPSAFEGCKILLSEPLEALNGNTLAHKTEKGKLWNALKKMFDL